MQTYPRMFIAYVLASLFCLGIYLFNPVSIPPVPVHATTIASIQAEVAREQKQKEIDRAAIVSAGLYRSYGCPISLAKPTALNAVTYGIPVRLPTAVVIVESSCQQDAISPAGAVGYMQVIPDLHQTSRRALLNRDINLKVGTMFLAELVHMYGLEEGVASYYGIIPGDNTAWDYADHVLRVAGYR